jgi:hypothetical protein
MGMGGYSYTVDTNAPYAMALDVAADDTPALPVADDVTAYSTFAKWTGLKPAGWSIDLWPMISSKTASTTTPVTHTVALAASKGAPALPPRRRAID